MLKFCLERFHQNQSLEDNFVVNPVLDITVQGPFRPVEETVSL